MFLLSTMVDSAFGVAKGFFCGDLSCRAALAVPRFAGESGERSEPKGGSSVIPTTEQREGGVNPIGQANDHGDTLGCASV